MGEYRLAVAYDLEAKDRDLYEVALSVAIQKIGIQLSETSWNVLCECFTKEYARLSRPRRSQ